MKVRIIKTKKGYIPQIFMQDEWHKDKFEWHGISSRGSEYNMIHYIYDYCTFKYLWQAKSVIKNWVKKNGYKLEDFKKELENPNVVYEAEI